MYKFWLSTGPHVDISQSYRLAYRIPGDQPFTGFQSSSLTDLVISDSIDIPTDIPDRFCGNTYLIVDIDYHNTIHECNEMNNIAATPFVLQCTGDVFQLQLNSFEIHPSPFWLNQEFLVTMGFDIKCWLGDGCMGVATHAVNSYPSHYFLDLVVSININIF